MSNGKGDAPRPAGVSAATWAENYARTFGDVLDRSALYLERAHAQMMRDLDVPPDPPRPIMAQCAVCGCEQPHYWRAFREPADDWMPQHRSPTYRLTCAACVPPRPP